MLPRLTQSDTPGTPSGTFCQQDKLLQSIRNIGPRRKLREINSGATVPSEYNADPAKYVLIKTMHLANYILLLS